MTVLRVEQRRGFAVEAVHHVHAVVCDRHGKVVASVGEDTFSTFRSAAKPFQLEVSLGLLPDALRAQLTPRDLALGAASHHGEPKHLAQVQSLLSRLERAPEHLFCGAHAPSHGPSAEAMWARGERPSVLHNNCSGKHSFMAAAAQALGAPVDYRPESHALQQRMIANMQERTGGGVQGTVVDGCGIPCFVLRLSSMARAWAALASAMAGEGPEALGEIGRAMHAEPWMMSGTHAFDGWLASHSDAVAKVGALGLLCVALPREGLGVAIKVSSGSDAARAAAGLAVLGRFFPNLLREEAPARFTQVLNVVGAHVGDFVAEFG
jgi:L-asparaginase II